MKLAQHVVKSILVTEKGTRLTEKENKYIFKVFDDANKVEIKSAVEQLFGVKVEKVNTMRRKGKLKRERTPNYGRTANWKRAIVSLAEGESIDLT
jgi:large subunit ribosomal protein L23